MIEQRLVIYRGEPVAIVGPDRVHFIAPWLDGRSADDPDARFVAFMCLYHQQALRKPAPVSSEVAEMWARGALIDDETLRAEAGLADHELAERMTVPVDQVAKRRADLGLPSESRA